ncbi:stage II sporulation protein P [Ruminococcus sp. AM07-21]|nr:stage II sporulation protein P [Ruminococcus sp. AM07-21]RHP56143.1 stage II sporulation protein P [Ruminococcus sp. AF31-16BH]
MLPGALFTGENVYRHLPLYRFLEKKTQVHSYEDQETYEKIAGENGKYLGERAKSEQLEAKEEPHSLMTEESQNPSEAEKEAEALAKKNKKSEKENKSAEATPVPEDTTVSKKVSESKTSPELEEPAITNEPDVHDTTETIAAVAPHPVIDLSPAKLADYDYLLGQFYIVDSNTEADAVQISAEDFLNQDFKISKDTESPQILIYHSHSQETFADSREGEEADTIVGVGDYLTQLLTENYGYKVVHLKEQFDMASGELDRSSAYDYARDYLEPYLQENPDIQVIIDLHRDGVPEDRHLVTEINGKPTAQILFYNGLSYTIEKGSLDYLPNPYIQQNLAFSFQLEYQAAQYYPEFYRGIYLAGYRYNLHLRPRSILLEAGAQTNTIQEVKNAMEPFADILNKVLQG